MLPASWKPAPIVDPIRLGASHDGGYVLPAAVIRRSHCLISMGVESDWSFESEFLDRTGGSVICFDHSVTPRFWAIYTVKRLLKGEWGRLFRYFAYRRFFARPDAEHRRLKVGYDVPGGITLDSILADIDGGSDILLKIDIEGWEYRILDQIAAHEDRFTGIVIEFHDVDLHRARIVDFLRRADRFRVACIHGNNYGGVDGDGDPIVIEMTLAPKDLVGPRGHSADRFSRPNNPKLPDLELRFNG